MTKRIISQLSDRARAALDRKRPVYNNRSQATAYKVGYMDALKDIARASFYADSESAEDQLAAITAWIENNAI